MCATASRRSPEFSIAVEIARQTPLQHLRCKRPATRRAVWFSVLLLCVHSMGAVWAVPSFPSEFTPKLAIIFSSLFIPVHPPCLARSRASSIATPDDRARCGRRQCVPRWSAERRPGPSQGPVRPRKTHRLVSQTSLRRSRKPPGRLPALHSSPMGEGRKTGRRAQPGVRKTKPRHSGALAETTAPKSRDAFLPSHPSAWRKAPQGACRSRHRSPD
jgi:hypothetical protein